MPWPAILAGAAALAGGFAGNRARKGESARDRLFQSEEAQKSRTFSERMRNTSWQAGIADMEAAGVNPALAYSSGGASAPMGDAGSGSGANLEDAITPGLSSAMQAKRMSQELKVMKAQEREIEARTGAIGVSNAYIINQGNTLDSQRAGVDLTNQSILLGMPGLRNISRFESGRYGQGTRTIRSLLQSVFGSGGAFRAR